MMVPMGTLMALPPSVSQLDGANRRDEIGPLFRQSLWLAVALGVVLFALLSLAVHALGPMGIAPEIRPGAAEFLRGIRWGVPALTLYYCMRYLRRPALDPADDGARLRWAAVAGAAGLGADVRPVRPARARRRRPGHRLGAHAVGAGAGVHRVPGAFEAVRGAGAVRAFRPAALGHDPRPARHRPADRGDGADGRRAVHRHRTADRAAGRSAGGRAP